MEHRPFIAKHAVVVSSVGPTQFMGRMECARLFLAGRKEGSAILGGAVGRWLLLARRSKAIASRTDTGTRSPHTIQCWFDAPGTVNAVLLHDAAQIRQPIPGDSRWATGRACSRSRDASLA
jgi:hypothetical protein